MVSTMIERDEDDATGRRVRPIRVLVVEDDADMREAIREALVLGGFDVTEAESGVSAIEYIEREEFDVLLTDIRLPGPSGTAIARVARSCAHPPTVILITAYPEWFDAAEAVQPFAVLRKPLNLFKLSAVVQEAAQDDRS
jgi:CheY-like chemotaxis protein